MGSPARAAAPSAHVITHNFAFGKNWAAYAGKITLREIEEAERGLAKLLGDRLDGHRLLDIGCGLARGRWWR